MTIILFVVYFLLCCWILKKLSFFSNSGLSFKWLVVLFALKVAIAALYGYMFSAPDIIGKIDTWNLFHNSVQEYHLLLEKPAVFFQNIFHNDSGNYGNVFKINDPYWNWTVRDRVLMYVVVFLNLFSFGNYYIDALLFTFVCFTGLTAFYKALRLLYPHSNKLTPAIAVFLIPSVLFWTSSLSKDAFLYMLMCVIVYQFTLWLQQKKKIVLRIIVIVVCLLIIFFIRNYIALSLIVTLGAWWCMNRYSKYAGRILLATIIVFTLAFFASSRISFIVNFPQNLVEKRIEFDKLKPDANTSLLSGELHATIASYIHNFPDAFSHVFMRPYLWDKFGKTYYPFALELLGLWVLFFAYIYITRRQEMPSQQKAFFYFGSLLLLINCILLGYTVNILGALVRYRSVFLPFFAAHIIIVLASFIPAFKNVKENTH